MLSLDGPLLDDEDGVRSRQEADGDDHHDGRRETVDRLQTKKTRERFRLALTLTLAQSKAQ